MTDHVGSRPNILLVMMDSSRVDTIGSYGGFGLSPNIDRLAAEGVRFTQAHTQAPVCTPARASLLTGTHTPVHGCVENGIDRRTELVTLPDILSGVGYHTILVGKAHFGGPVPDTFTEQHVLAGEKGADVDDEYAQHLAQHGYARASAQPNEIPEEVFCDAFLVDQTIDAIRRHRQQDDGTPFFAICSMPSPHSPLDPPGRWATLFDDRELPPLNFIEGEERFWPEHLSTLVGSRGVEADEAERSDGSLDLAEVDSQRRRYYGLAAYCDAQVGRLLTFLEESGLDESTLIVFTTDHGQQYYDHGFNDKHTFYDASWRIPLVLRWPGVIPADVTSDWAMTSDLTATFAAAAGATAPFIQGFDLVASLADPHGEGRSCAAAVLNRSLALVTDDWKLEYFPESGSGRMFNRDRDPQEQVDRWSDPEVGFIRQRMLEALLTWRADLTDVQYLQEHLTDGGPVARRVVRAARKLTGADAERRLSQRVTAAARLYPNNELTPPLIRDKTDDEEESR